MKSRSCFSFLCRFVQGGGTFRVKSATLVSPCGGPARGEDPVPARLAPRCSTRVWDWRVSGSGGTPGFWSPTRLHLWTARMTAERLLSTDSMPGSVLMQSVMSRIMYSSP